jgi:xylose isomerase
MLESYSAERAAHIRAHAFDRIALGQPGLPYERLDQLTIELLLGVR